MWGNILSIGDKIELFHCSNRLGTVSKPKIYMSQLLDLQDINKASIAMPIQKGRVVLLDVGETYSLCFYTKNGLYQCKAVVTERFRNQNLFIANVEFTSELEKNQRRQYYRLECLIDFKFGAVVEEGQDPKTWISGVIIDISGGGIRFYSQKQLQADMLIVSFSLFTTQGLKNFKIESKIISCLPTSNRNAKYEYRVEFSNIKKEDREIIVRYIFEEERKRRRKERGLN
ncbi:flagellar brake protein [Clostridium sp. Marseille-P299]|uniref:flagellar brake protein n=1 Tax=Clostridium sp. Marseille-P299 TaxID=1805477 RepID=UPI00082C3BF8|nr:PilZ domain-containing protein [Clostridium sp. Marseille-P299]